MLQTVLSLYKKIKQIKLRMYSCTLKNIRLVYTWATIRMYQKKNLGLN